MKKILAVLLALAMVFAFAACGGKTEDPTEPDTTAEVVEESSAEDASVPASDEATSEGSSEDASEAESSVDESSEAASEASKGLNSEDAAEVVAFYNAAVAATKDKAPGGNSKMKLIDGSLKGDGAIGALLKVLEPAAVKALAKNSNPTDYIPGNETDLLVTDVKSASATSKNGVTTVKINLKDQTDGSDGDPHNGGSVARGIGTLGSIDGALGEIGAELASGRDTVKLTYNNAYLTVKIDEATGKITGGTWHYVVNIFVGNAKAKISIVSATLKNFKGQIDYTVTI